MVRKSLGADVFSSSNPVKPPRGLLHRIIRRLGLEKNLKTTKEKLVIASFALLLFCAILIFTANFLWREIAKSELGPIISLSVSDTMVVLSHAGDFMLAFLESIPVLYVTAVLAAIILLLAGLKLVLRYASRASLLIKTIHPVKSGIAGAKQFNGVNKKTKI